MEGKIYLLPCRRSKHLSTFGISILKNHTPGNRHELETQLREVITNALLRPHHRSDRSF